MLKRFSRKSAFEFDVLPEGVRTALAYQGTELKRNHVESLFAQDKFKNLGFYLLMKAAQDQDETQKDLLRLLATKKFDPAKLEIGETPVRDAFENLDVVGNVYGGKLAQVSRVGFNTWTDNFDNVLKPITEDEPNKSLFILANASLVGIKPIADLTVNKGERLDILKPNRFNQTSEPVGFTISGRGEVSDLQPDFSRPDDAVIFDDVENAGKTRKAALEFWDRGEEVPSQPMYIAAIRTGQAS